MNPDSVIVVRGLTKLFHGTPVLKNLDLDVLRGETVVVLGRSGTGKSVLLKHLNALLRPYAGTIHFGGVDVTRMTEAALVPVRRRIGMLFQGGALFDSLTIADNVAPMGHGAGIYAYGSSTVAGDHTILATND